jgi:hypothetical protein
MGAGMMRLLATIPDLGDEPAVAAHRPLLDTEPGICIGPERDLADSADSAVSEEPAAVMVPTERRTILVSPKQAFPWASIAALVAVAAAVWSLASWNDARRLARQQSEIRLADRPVAAPTEAVLR